MNEPLDAIAIVGMACRFPGAPDVDTFWRNLVGGVESIRHYADDELLAAGVDPATLADPAYVRAGAPLDGVELFDAAFFGMNPSVAQITDPQQRVFLELAWHAMEHAGHDPSRFAGDVGVFGGLSINTYLIENLATNRSLIESHGLLQAAMANRGDHLATLTAYKLNLRGPAYGVQSTCSTALSAVHLACQSLLACQTDMALAGGVSVRVPQTAGYLFQEGGVASPDGHCRPFDARARGTVFGSGAGVVVLRRLEDALADGDVIHAIIRGSAANNDGGEKTGYTAPSSAGQSRAIRMAQAVAGVTPDTIGYVECHGTGTVLGDPIEIEALASAFAASPRTEPCDVGSVKSNVGHLDTAAGIAGLIKTVLMLSHRTLVPTLHFEQPSPHIDWARTPFRVNTALREWPPIDSAPRRAGVSSFGIGGTNVHLVLEEAPARPRPPEAAGWHALLLSARTPAALEEQTAALARALAARPDLPPGDVALTLQLGRRPFEHRRALVCRSTREAISLLAKLPPWRVFTGQSKGEARPIAFLLPAAGGRQPDMARELAEALPAFRAHLEAAVRALAGAGVDVGPTLGDHGAIASRAEPALFAFEYALARTLIDWGVTPGLLAGDGIGEYAALAVAEALSLDDAARLVALRARLLERLPAGAMTMAMIPEAELAPLLIERGLSLAMVGRPSLCAASGAPSAIADLERTLAERGVPTRRLALDRALQSPAVDPILAELAAGAAALTFREPVLPIASSLDGALLTGRGASAWGAYLADQLRRTLRLSAAIEHVHHDPDRIALQVGPGRTLLNVARLHPAKGPRHVVLATLAMSQAEDGTMDGRGFAVADPTDDASEHSAGRLLVTALMRLWVHGVPIDWAAQQRGHERRRAALPGYPFERRRLWLDPSPARAEAALPPRRVDPADWLYVPSWRRSAPPPVAPAALGGSVLLVEDSHGLGELLAARLTALGCDVQRVEPHALAPGRADVDAGTNADAGAAEHWTRLFAGLERSGRAPDRIVHMSAVAPVRRIAGGPEAAARAEQIGFRPLVSLLQALGATWPGRAMQLDVISSQVHAVTGDESLSPEKAVLLGPVLVAGQEYGSLRCRGIDVALPPPASAAEEELANLLVREIAQAPSTPLVAYRGGHRWVRGFEPVRLERPDDAASPVRAGGTYLVTGGLGGIGLRLAAELARRAPIKLALLGRQPPGPAARTAIAALERAGNEVMVVAADVADREEMSRAVADVRGRLGPICGLVHAAGVPAGGALQLKTDAIADRVLAPKVRGTLILHQLLAAEPLDFVVYCGSRTAIMGGFGQADYVAANAFLDAWAHEQARVRGPRVVTIDWCGWKDVGMLANAAGAARPAAAAGTDAAAHAEAALPPGASRASGPSSAPSATAAPTASAAPPAEALLAPHPLLGPRLPSSAGEIVHEVELGVDTHWVLADHRIHGNPAIAGTTYLEMVRAALEPERGDRDLELADIYFVVPLVVQPGERRIARLTLRPSEDGWRFEAASRAPGSAATQTHALGSARLLAPAPEALHDLAAIAARCDERERTVSDEDALDDDHGPRWQCLRRIRLGRGEVLTTLELPAEFAGDLERLWLHPSMMDKSVGTGHEFLAADPPHIPYSYKRVLIRRPLARRVHVHTRPRSADSLTSETPSFHLSVLDDGGRELVRVEEFSLKRINDVAAVYRAASAQAAPAALSASTPSRRAPASGLTDGPSPPGGARAALLAELMHREGISPDEGADLFARILADPRLPQVVVSTRDLDALLARGLLHTSPAARELGGEAGAAAPPRPLQSRPDMAVPYIAPSGELQEQLAAIWRDVLGVDRVGVRDSFFDLGGDSVVAIQIVSRLKAATGRQVEVVHLFQSPTIEALERALGPVVASPPADGSAPAADDGAARGARRRARALARRRDAAD